MITLVDIGGAQVGVCPIEPQQSRLGRRERERMAVDRIISAIIGPEATLGHLPGGAPSVSGCPFLSIAHSRLLAAVAVHPTAPVGIDAEEDRHSTLRRVASKFLSAGEMEWVGDSDLLRAWTIKEAVYKAAGAPGLSVIDGIALHPGLARATACGHAYAIASTWIGPTLITVATRI